jgi:hypothetical protein
MVDQRLHVLGALLPHTDHGDVHRVARCAVTDTAENVARDNQRTHRCRARRRYEFAPAHQFASHDIAHGSG